MIQAIGDSKQVDVGNCENAQTSRLIIKNLPSKITSDRLKQIFIGHGLVTDCQLKFNSSGKFRNFAFIGFRTVDEAQNARQYFNNTYLDSSKIQVEFCRKLEHNQQAKKKIKENVEKAPSNKDCLQLIFENLPRNVKKKTLKNFIAPVKPLKIEVKIDDNESITTAIVKVTKKSDVKVLEKLDGKFFGGQKINVKTCENLMATDDNNPSTISYSKDVTNIKEQTDLISETGRLFVRNIPYVCTLDDVRKAFENFGPLADLKMPLDPSTKKHKGYAMVSFVLPENALKAFAEMDGTVFNGRMLHVVP
uniref:RRM domain-containing protein n=1 Tax=Romanomermis culicivorax TaxID=13658 RepID=A0A915HUU0_ROMCU